MSLKKIRSQLSIKKLKKSVVPAAAAFFSGGTSVAGKFAFKGGASAVGMMALQAAAKKAQDKKAAAVTSADSSASGGLIAGMVAPQNRKMLIMGALGLLAVVALIVARK